MGPAKYNSHIIRSWKTLYSPTWEIERRKKGMAVIVEITTATFEQLLHKHHLVKSTRSTPSYVWRFPRAPQVYFVISHPVTRRNQPLYTSKQNIGHSISMLQQHHVLGAVEQYQKSSGRVVSKHNFRPCWRIRGQLLIWMRPEILEMSEKTHIPRDACNRTSIACPAPEPCIGFIAWACEKFSIHIKKIWAIFTASPMIATRPSVNVERGLTVWIAQRSGWSAHWYRRISDQTRDGRNMSQSH